MLDSIQIVQGDSVGSTTEAFGTTSDISSSLEGFTNS